MFRRRSKVVAGGLGKESRSKDDYHIVKIKQNTFVVPRKYRADKEIGHGAYGVVISAVDETTGKKIAIKKVG
jgi:hypothetical protein